MCVHASNLCHSLSLTSLLLHLSITALIPNTLTFYQQINTHMYIHDTHMIHIHIHHTYTHTHTHSMDDFSCAVESTVLLHGRLYVTDRFVCFYSNLFGLEKKIRIPFSHIAVVTKENTAVIIPNAIAISTFKKQYIFRSFWDRDHCFFMLKSFINKYRYVHTYTHTHTYIRVNTCIHACM